MGDPVPEVVEEVESSGGQEKEDEIKTNYASNPDYVTKAQEYMDIISQENTKRRERTNRILGVVSYAAGLGAIAAVPAIGTGIAVATLAGSHIKRKE